MTYVAKCQCKSCKSSNFEKVYGNSIVCSNSRLKSCDTVIIGLIFKKFCCHAHIQYFVMLVVMILDRVVPWFPMISEILNSNSFKSYYNMDKSNILLVLVTEAIYWNPQCTKSRDKQ